MMEQTEILLKLRNGVIDFSRALLEAARDGKLTEEELEAIVDAALDAGPLESLADAASHTAIDKLWDFFQRSPEALRARAAELRTEAEAAAGAGKPKKARRKSKKADELAAKAEEREE
jgi:hypothetical protein